MSILTEIRRLSDQLFTQGPRRTLIAGVDKLTRWTTGRPAYTYGWITPSILLGGQPATRVWEQLIRRGITGIVNLRDEYDDQHEIAHLPVRYLYLPTIDNTPPSPEHFIAGVKFLDEEIARGGKVYVHCWEGLGRSPTIVAAYLVRHGMTPDDAWAMIRKVRPFIRPTLSQQQSLLTYARLYGTPVEG